MNSLHKEINERGEEASLLLKFQKAHPSGEVAVVVFTFASA